MSEEKMTIELPHVMDLEVPISWGKEEEPRTSITINRRLKAKDFKGMIANKMKFDDMIRLISKVTGEPMAFIEELDAADMMKASEVVNSFLPSGLTTGDNQ